MPFFKPNSRASRIRRLIRGRLVHESPRYPVAIAARTYARTLKGAHQREDSSPKDGTASARLGSRWARQCSRAHAQMYCTCLVLLACHCVSSFFPSSLFTTGLYRGPGRPRLVSVKCQCQSLSMLRFNHQQARPRDSSSGASGVLPSMRDVTRTGRQGRAGFLRSLREGKEETRESGLARMSRFCPAQHWPAKRHGVVVIWRWMDGWITEVYHDQIGVVQGWQGSMIGRDGLMTAISKAVRRTEDKTLEGSLSSALLSSSIHF